MALLSNILTVILNSNGSYLAVIAPTKTLMGLVGVEQTIVKTLQALMAVQIIEIPDPELRPV